MVDNRSILKGILAVLVCIWTFGISINVILDLFRSNGNYFGDFFAVTIGLALIIFGDGLLFGLYIFLKRLFK